MCRSLPASRSVYYQWLKNPMSEHKKRDIQLKQKILTEYAKSKRVYGSPRIHAALKNQDEACGKKRVVCLMKELQIRSVIKNKFKTTTNSKHNKPVADNLLNRNFNPAEPNNTWVSDITYIRTKDGWLYLSVVIDLFSRRVIGWSTSKRMTTSFVIKSLENTIRGRKPKTGLLFHSDQGVQCASEEIQNFLSKHKIICSMSRKGECYDNFVAESFFDSLKSE